MAIRKVVGQVTIEERNEIQQLFERRNGLNELAKILTADNHELYEKLVKDMGETGTKSKVGGIAWARNTNGRALTAATGKSTSIRVKFI